MTNDQMDWNGIWKKQVAAFSEMMGGMDCARSWDNDDSARNYWQMALNSRPLIRQMVRHMPVGKNIRVLDVGAGPGTLTIPLASQVGHVTAVEPAGAMARVLRENIASEALGNVACVHKRWEDVDEKTDIAPPYDVVVASYSLGMPDLCAAVEKMQRVSRGHVFLLWFAGPASWDRENDYLFEALFDRPYTGMPRADIIFNLLCQMDIYPNVEVFPGRMDHHFNSLDDLVADFAARMPPLSDAQIAKLKAYYEDVVEKRDGRVILPYTWRSMKLWWEKG